MPKTSVYLSQELADKAKELNLSISKVLQDALDKVVEEHTGCCSRCGKSLLEDVSELLAPEVESSPEGDIVTDRR